jgi:hypothetical protein
VRWSKAPLHFNQTRSEKQYNIQVEIAPDGLHVRAEYTGGLSTIMGAIERLKALGVVELVNTNRPAVAPAAKPKAETVEPLYKPDGTACCPVHKRPPPAGVIFAKPYTTPYKIDWIHESGQKRSRSTNQVERLQSPEAE